MAPDSSLSPIEAIPKPEVPARCKFRVRFRKAGNLRLVSHHDLMHVFERMFRRADLTLPVTQGFNPRPRMWFALSLALGVAGLNEVLEFEIAEPIAVEEVERRLTHQCPPGLEIASVRAIDVKMSAHVRRAWYRLPLMEIREGEAPAEPCFPSAQGSAGALRARLDEFLQLTESWAERLRPNPRRINIRPYVDELRATDEYLEMALWITPNGAARADEVIHALGLGDSLAQGAVIERTDLELYDELPPGTPGPPAMQPASMETHGNEKETLIAARPTAIGDSPFSFDT